MAGERPILLDGGGQGVAQAEQTNVGGQDACRAPGEIDDFGQGCGQIERGRGSRQAGQLRGYAANEDHCRDDQIERHTRVDPFGDPLVNEQPTQE